MSLFKVLSKTSIATALAALASDGTPVSVAAGTTSGQAVNLSQLGGSVAGSDAWLKQLASSPDTLIAGVITRDANGAATSAGVVWPDGTTGTYTATTVSTAFPGAVDAYTITWVGSTTKTATQSAVTRDASTGAVTTRPALTVS